MTESDKPGEVDGLDHCDLWLADEDEDGETDAD